MSTMRPFATAVDAAWLDYNGHVTDAAYATIAAAANEELCVDIGMSEPYRKETGRALYSARVTINYRHEIAPQATIRVLRTIARLGAKSMTVTSEFQVGDQVAATTEHVYVLVDSLVGGSVTFNDDERARIEPLVGTES